MRSLEHQLVSKHFIIYIFSSFEQVDDRVQSNTLAQIYFYIFVNTSDLLIRILKNK